MPRFNVSLIVGSVVGGYGLWTYGLSNVMPHADVPLQNHGAALVLDWMDRHKQYWSHEAMQFANSPSTLTRMVEHPQGTDAPVFEVTVNTQRFDGVPMRRVTAFFPNVSAAEVAARFIEPDARKRWDKNYRFFEEMVTLPTPKAVEQLRSGFVAQTRQWCGHIIESSTLDKFGVQPRSFVYERTVARRDDGAVCAIYRSIDGSEADDVGTVAASKASPLGRLALETPASDGTTLAKRLRAAFFDGPAKKTTEVTMLWQEALFLPVRRRHLELTTFDIPKSSILDGQDSFPNTMGVGSVVFAIAQAFMSEGSPVTSTLHDALYVSPEVIKSPDGRNAKNKGPKATTAVRDDDAARRNEEVGCLMVMTSCNDGKLPTIPGPIERFAMKRLTNNTYEMLLADIAASRKSGKLVSSPLQQQPNAKRW